MRKLKYPNAQKTINDFCFTVSESYCHPAIGETGIHGKKKQEIVADEFGISRLKVRKILITTGDLVYSETRTIEELIAEGLMASEISAKTGLARSTINSLIPYTKGVYKLAEVSAAADRTALYRKRKEVVSLLTAAIKAGEWKEALWECVISFENYPFITAKRNEPFGDKFTYQMSESPDHEIIIRGKRIGRGQIEEACERALEAEEITDEYLFPILGKFGIVRV